MKILVLGGSSFTGRAFISLASAAGHEIADLSRPEHDINGGLPQAASLAANYSGFDRVVNFIALNMVGESWQYAPAYYRTNVEGIARVCEWLGIVPGLKRFVQVSTPEVYGSTGTFLKEGSPFNPSTPYANSRAAADVHLELLHRQHGFPVCFTRTVNVYGPGQQLYRIIPKAALCALTGRKLPLHGGGTSTRSFIHVRDVAAGILAVLERGVGGSTYHMATARQTAIRDLVGAVCERVGVRLEDVVEDAPDRPGKDMAYQLDDSKIRRELGWSDTVSLEAGLDETVAWIRAELPRLAEQSTEYRHAA